MPHLKSTPVRISALYQSHAILPGLTQEKSPSDSGASLYISWLVTRFASFSATIIALQGKFLVPLT